MAFFPRGVHLEIEFLRLDLYLPIKKLVKYLYKVQVNGWQPSTTKHLVQKLMDDSQAQPSIWYKQVFDTLLWVFDNQPFTV